MSSIEQLVELIVSLSLQTDFSCVSFRHNRKKIHTVFQLRRLTIARMQTLGEPGESSLENSQRTFGASEFSIEISARNFEHSEISFENSCVLKQ